MNSYILKNEEEEKKVLLYQEQTSYSFTPKSARRKVKKITVFDKGMLNSIIGSKIVKEYNRLLQIIYSLISSDDTTSGDVLIAYTEIERIKEYLLSQSENLKSSFVDKYLKKLYVLELELKKVHVIELRDEIEEKGKGR